MIFLTAMFISCKLNGKQRFYRGISLRSLGNHKDCPYDLNPHPSPLTPHHPSPLTPLHRKQAAEVVAAGFGNGLYG